LLVLAAAAPAVAEPSMFAGLAPPWLAALFRSAANAPS
jgi:hypothetical protein